MDIAIAAIFNGSFLEDLDNGVMDVRLKTRRQGKGKKDRSTSSSSGAGKQKSEIKNHAVSFIYGSFETWLIFLTTENKKDTKINFRNMGHPQSEAYIGALMVLGLLIPRW